MSEWKIKRFWKAAGVDEREAGFAIALDGRPVRTPGKALLAVPTRALADAIAAEWDAQEDAVNPMNMPLTRAANSAIDKVSVQRDEVVQMLADYGDADLTCYRADTPEGLVALQRAAWDPLLDWADARYGARLQPRIGVMHAAQAPDALRALARPLGDMDAFQLTAVHDLITLSGSLVIGLAVTEAMLPAEELWERSRIDERWQEDQWGADEEATEAAARKKTSFLQAGSLFRLLSEKV